MRRYRGHIIIDDDAMLMFADSSEDSDVDLPPLPGNGFGLIACQAGVIVLRTGILSGPVGFDIDIHTDTPPIAPGWEHIEEMTVHALSSIWSATDINLGFAPGFESIDLATGPGPVRVRANSTGRDTHRNDAVDVECERYRLELWPTAADAAPAVLARSSAVAADTAAGTWPADETDTAPITPDGAHSVSGPTVSAFDLAATQHVVSDDNARRGETRGHTKSVPPTQTDGIPNGDEVCLHNRTGSRPRDRKKGKGMSQKVRGRLVAISIIVAALVVAGFMILYTQYGTVTWIVDPPPKMHFVGLGYTRTNLPPTSDLPSGSWTPKRRMLPLWFKIFFPVGFDPTSIYLQWRDGLFYQYGTPQG